MLLRVAALLALPLLSTCRTQPLGPDAQGTADGGGRDAGRDAGSDAGADAGYDGGVTGWRRLTGLPEDCVVESATEPAAELTIIWRPCDDGSEGCWVSSPLLPSPFTIFDRGRSDGRQGYITVAYRDRGGRFMAALVSTLEGAKGLWRAYEPAGDARLCIVTGVGSGEGHGSFAVVYSDGRARERDQDAVFHAPIEELSDALAPAAVVTGDIAFGDPQRWSVTAELVAYTWHPGAIVYVVGADGSQYALFDDPVVGSPQNPSAVGSDVFWEDWSSSVRVAHASRDRAPSFFRDIAPDDIWDHVTDGIEHTWVEARGRGPDGFESVTLMAAPYTASAGELEPRAVASLDSPWPSTFGGGWYAFRRPDPPRLEVIRTADGTRRTWLPPAGHDLLSRAPLYASDREVMVHTQRDGLDYLIRVDPHTLPASD